MYRSIKDLTFEVRKKVHKSPRDWRDQNIYHLLIDRFDNNDPAISPAKVPATQEPLGKNRSDGARFKGGKIAGITRRLDYIKSLGCTTLWISPPFKNRVASEESYHGYAIQNFLEIDPRFGTKEELQELIVEAHSRKMFVIIDIVINHTGDNWEYKEGPDVKYDGSLHSFGGWRAADGTLIEDTPKCLGPDDAVWPIEFQSSDCYYRLGSIENYDEPEETRKGDLQNLKALNHHCEHVVHALIQCYKWWIAELDCDGFRIDAAKHCDPRALSNFVNAIREYAYRIGKKNFLLLAEVIGEDEEILKYVGMNRVEKSDSHAEYPHLSACLDFPLHFVLGDVIKGEKSWHELARRYQKLMDCYRDYSRAGNYLVTFLENHDQVGKEYYRFMYGESDQRLAMLALGYVVLAMGIPCIYYGTEQGLNGGGDEGDYFVRETMFGSDWGGKGIKKGHLFDQQGPVFLFVAKLCRLRRQEPALRYGRQYLLPTGTDERSLDACSPHEHVFAFVRILDTSIFLVVFNTDADEHDCCIDINCCRSPLQFEAVDLLTDKDATKLRVAGKSNRGSLNIAARSICVFRVST